jgi:hypothetical protein
MQRKLELLSVGNWDATVDDELSFNNEEKSE